MIVEQNVVFHRTPDDLTRSNRNRQKLAPDFGRGFAKRDVSSSPIFQLLQKHYRAHRDRFTPEAPEPYLLNADPHAPAALAYRDVRMALILLKTFQPMHEEWCGFRLVPTACYGMRMYMPGAFLYDHVDREETHIISSTLCIAHDLDESWPLSIEDGEGQPAEINLNPGELVLYESARLMHGRPYELEGRYYVAQFIHYKPFAEAAALA